MTLKPSGDYADHYPSVAGRVAAWRSVMEGIPRVPLTRDWVRDLPAARLRRPATDSPPKLLAPVGYLFVHNRYTRRDAFPSLYLSDGVTTASSEVFGAAAVKQGPLGTPDQSRLQLVVHAHLPDVLDLTNDAVRGSARRHARRPHAAQPPARRRLSLGALRAYELPQCLGEIAHELGIGAILFPSTPASKGVNVVIFTEHLAATGGWYETTDPVSMTRRSDGLDVG